MTAIELLEREINEALDVIESMARQHCYTSNSDLQTDSGAISANADALKVLDKIGKFRIACDAGRMVIGYWPENDPEKKESKNEHD